MGTLLRTADGGSTWDSADSGTTSDLYGVACRSADNCVAVGDDGTLQTGAAGLTGAAWTALQSGTANTLWSITCPGSGCLVVGDNGTLVATAAADVTTWHGVESGTTYPLYSVSCWTGPAQPYCFAAGFRGTIVGGPPGGPWTVMPSGTHESLNGVLCANYAAISPCAVVGEHGFMARYRGRG